MNFDGGFIWDTGYEFAIKGTMYKQNGVPASHAEACILADDYAQAYGATRYYGKFGGPIMGIEDDTYDGVSYWQCLKCHYTWSRWTGEEVTHIAPIKCGNSAWAEAELDKILGSDKN